MHLEFVLSHFQCIDPFWRFVSISNTLHVNHLIIAWNQSSLENLTSVWYILLYLISRVRSNAKLLMLSCIYVLKKLIFNIKDVILYDRYPDTFVRNRAVELMAELNDDQFCDILPQLIQVSTTQNQNYSWNIIFLKH